MKKIFFFLLLVFIPNIIFAQTDTIVWSKYLGNGITWKQTNEDNIIRKSGIEIYRDGFITNWQTMDSYKICAYQELLGKGIETFSKAEQVELKDIGSIVDGKYAPLDVGEMSEKELQTLYRIAIRHCGNNRTYFLPELGKRWIFISTNNTTTLWDHELRKYVGMFLPERLIKKGKTGFFGVGLLGGNEKIEFLPYDGKSYIDGIDRLFEDYSKGDKSASVIVNNYILLRNKSILVTFTLLRSTGSETYTKEFKIVTP